VVLIGRRLCQSMHVNTFTNANVAKHYSSQKRATVVYSVLMELINVPRSSRTHRIIIEILFPSMYSNMLPFVSDNYRCLLLMVEIIGCYASLSTATR
jgi:hypothetical protein